MTSAFGQSMSIPVETSFNRDASFRRAAVEVNDNQSRSPGPRPRRTSRVAAAAKVFRDHLGHSVPFG